MVRYLPCSRISSSFSQHTVVMVYVLLFPTSFWWGVFIDSRVTYKQKMSWKTRVRHWTEQKMFLRMACVWFETQLRSQLWGITRIKEEDMRSFPNLILTRSPIVFHRIMFHRPVKKCFTDLWNIFSHFFTDLWKIYFTDLWDIFVHKSVKKCFTGPRNMFHRPKKCFTDLWNIFLIFSQICFTGPPKCPEIPEMWVASHVQERVKSASGDSRSPKTRVIVSMSTCSFKKIVSKKSI